MTMRKTILQSTALVLSLLATQVMAAVSADEAAQLGATLTPLGAERAGNADGSIPEWTGGIGKEAGAVDAKGFLADPFASEQPLFTITAQNLDQYKDKLSDGQVAMFKRYPESYRIPVYPTHRTVAMPQAVLDNAVKNATGAKSSNGGLAIENVLPGVPFPIPQSGAEAMWNHLLRYQGVTINSKYDSWNVDAAGVATLATTGQAFINYPIYQDLSQPINDTDV